MDKVLNYLNNQASSVTGRNITMTMNSTFSQTRTGDHVGMSSIEIITLLSQIEDDYNVEFDELPCDVHELVLWLRELV